jgi:hypothetical protein
MIGSQTEVTKKLNPNFCRGKLEFVHNSHTNAAVINTTVAANTSVTSRAISSPSLSRAKNEREPVTGPAPFTAVELVATFLQRLY